MPFHRRGQAERVDDDHTHCALRTGVSTSKIVGGRALDAIRRRPPPRSERSAGVDSDLPRVFCAPRLLALSRAGRVGGVSMRFAVRTLPKVWLHFTQGFPEDCLGKILGKQKFWKLDAKTHALAPFVRS